MYVPGTLIEVQCGRYTSGAEQGLHITARRFVPSLLLFGGRVRQQLHRGAKVGICYT
jgi:hypothetical protein